MPLRTHLEKYNLVCTSMKKYNYLIVGSGLFGATFAHLAHKQGKTCLVIDKRPHLGGNIYCENIEGINVHKYGAHIFHTSNKEVWNFVNSIVEFNRYTNSPVANYKGKLYNLPFNMNTFYQMWGVTTPAEAQAKIDEQKAEAVAKMKADGVSEPRNLEEQAQVLIGKDIYERLIKGYTEKQWGRKCTDLPAFIIKRLPVRLIFDNNYFNDKYQGIPIGGYNKLIDGLLDGADTKVSVDFFKDEIELPNGNKGVLKDHWKELAFIIGHRRVGVAVELNDGIDEIPHLLIGSMEDMRPIFMHIDALNILTIDISAQMWSLIYYQTSFALLMSQMGECGSKEAGTNDEIIILLHKSFACFFIYVSFCRKGMKRYTNMQTFRRKY